MPRRRRFIKPPKMIRYRAPSAWSVRFGGGGPTPPQPNQYVGANSALSLLGP